MRDFGFASKVLSYEANAQRSYMDHLNSSAYNKERFHLTNKKIKLLKAIYFSMLASFSTFGSLFNKLPSIHKRRIESLNKQLADDFLLLPIEKKNEIEQLSFQAFRGGNIDRELASKMATSTYATTYTQFAPIIYDWTLSLMKRAKTENQHIVFMARDGLAPYRMAQIIQQSVPQLRSLKISYVYLSRKVVDGDRDMLKDYLNQELGKSSSRRNQNYLFVDLGFLGSMCSKIRSALKETNKDAKCEFEFLISTGKEARGFAGTMQQNLRAVRSAGKNRAVYWLEDTHQGLMKSPKRLVKDEHGKILPNTFDRELSEPSTEFKSTDSLDFLCRNAAQKAIFDFVCEKDHINELNNHDGATHLKGDLRKRFDEWLQKLRLNRFLYIKHS